MPQETKTIQVQPSLTFCRLEVDVLVRIKGLIKQLPLYERKKVLYAKIGGGYVTLSTNGSLSNNSGCWEEFLPLTNETFSYRKPHFGFLTLC